MRNITDRAPQSGRVTAVYLENTLSFSMKRGATLSDLAARLARIEERSGRTPFAINVKFDA